MWHNLRNIRFMGVVLLALGVLLLAACSAGGEEVVAPEKAVAPVAKTIVQVATSEAQAPAAAAPSGWDTEYSLKVGFKLLNTLDSSGPPAWDSAAHPDVFFTTVGPGYAGILSEKVKLPGMAVIDAHTKEVIAYRAYDLGAENYFEPHGLGVSPDGKFIYLPTGVSAGFRDVGTGRYLVIDAQTLNIHQILGTKTAPHHAKAYRDSQGNDRVLLYTFRGQFAILDPTDNNRVVGGFTNEDLTGRGYLGYVDPSGKYMFVSVRPPRGMETDGGVAVVDTESWRVVKAISTHDESPIWVDFTADGKYAFVSNGHHSNVAKIHMEGDPGDWELVGLTQAGVGGPYGIRLNWDDTQLWAISKGEGSHNRGMTIGLADPVRMPRSWGHPGAWYTGCLRGDHMTLNPWDKSELWLSCNSSFEVAVWDMDKKEVKTRIPMPEGGSTHSGSFVHYEPGFVGEVLSDHNGVLGRALEEKKAIAAAAAKQAGTR